jgi:hypothetical protein
MGGAVPNPLAQFQGMGFNGLNPFGLNPDPAAASQMMMLNMMSPMFQTPPENNAP